MPACFLPQPAFSIASLVDCFYHELHGSSHDPVPIAFVVFFFPSVLWSFSASTFLGFVLTRGSAATTPSKQLHPDYLIVCKRGKYPLLKPTGTTNLLQLNYLLKQPYSTVLYCTVPMFVIFFLNFWTNRVKALFNTAINAVALAGAES